jgi:hypothetical protein
MRWKPDPSFCPSSETPRLNIPVRGNKLQGRILQKVLLRGDFYITARDKRSGNTEALHRPQVIVKSAC